MPLIPRRTRGAKDELGVKVSCGASIVRRGCNSQRLDLSPEVLTGKGDTRVSPYLLRSRSGVTSYLPPELLGHWIGCRRGRRLGGSPAGALASSMIPGGKQAWSPPPRPIPQAGEAFSGEALAPLTDDLPRQVKASADLLVFQTGGGEEHHLGPDDLAIRRRIRSCQGMQPFCLVRGEDNLIRAATRHLGHPFGRQDTAVVSKAQP